MRSCVGILIVLLVLFSCSQKQEIDKESMFPKGDYMSVENEEVKLSSLFSEYRLVSLETNDSCLISGYLRNKILKHDSIYYVLSSNTILCFDLDGHFVRRIAHVGSGPGEYSEIFDFDIISSLDVGKELWISTIGGILVYDAVAGDYIRSMKMNQFVSQFKYVNENTILTIAPEDTIFQVWDMNGNVRKKFMKKDLANSVQSQHQFFTYQGKIVYHYGGTQAGIVYDPDTDECSLQPILQPQANILTPDVNREYYDKYGDRKYYKELANEYITSSTVRILNDQGVFTWIAPGMKFVMTTYTSLGYQTFVYSDKAKVINDLLPTIDNQFLATLNYCGSDDSFLFMIPAETIQKDGVKADDNPWLLDVKRITHVD